MTTDNDGPSVGGCMILIILWCLLGFFNFGTMNAEMGWEATHELRRLHESQRDNMGFMIGESCAIPPIELITSAIISNFWQHGWSVTSKPWQYEKERHD